ncbi:MAG TPA: molybdenum cofactor biosynthesis protein MoaE [Verrucomicrobiae bacterium]|nr:molybdenum cofactor biosynthesis protein MoaE [Verrucomicrobiae bacterium]
MHIDVQLTPQRIPETLPVTGPAGATGAWVEFRGVVRGEENGAPITALDYEAYPEMAVREMRRLLTELAERHPCLAVKVIHRVGEIPVGETAIYVGVAGRHRAGAFALLAAFMDRLKQDVPIWKRGGRGAEARPDVSRPAAASSSGRRPALLSLEDARALVESRCPTLPAERVALADACGRVLRETVCAAEDWPAVDKSTRDGYAVRADDPAESFRVVDTLHAADWKPRQLPPGEAVRVATGASLPCEGLRVLMQEDVERLGDHIRMLARDDSANVRRRGEEVRRGEALLAPGTRLNGGALALLATAGCAAPPVSPRLRVLHFTTGDEIVPPAQMPQPGQIRDSNSFLIRGLLQRWPCVVEHAHLRENFAAAQADINARRSAVESASVILVSGGASVGDKDFTRPLLEWLGFEIVFSQVNLRPGKPLIFGVNAARVAFGLPGNPLSHFVCFHAFVAAALGRLTGESPAPFQSAMLGTPLDDAASPRETLWPARWEGHGDAAQVRPLAWASSGDVTSLARANALLRVPAHTERLAAGTRVDFLPADF